MLLYDKIVTPCLEEDDTYALRSRKLVVIAFSFIAVNALLIGVPIGITSAVYDPSFGSHMVCATMVFVTITSAIIPYTYLRITKTLPDWVTDLQTWSALITSATCFTLFTHQGSTTLLVSVAVWVGIIAQVRWRPLFLVYGIAINILHALINDFGDELPVLHETFYSKQILSVRILYLVGANLAPQVFFGIGIYVIMREVIGRGNQADAAIAMNLAVADKLRRYDTHGVAEILAANKGKVDDKLLNAFSAIQHNLQEYRPHIPDYVIAATTSDYAHVDYRSPPTAPSYTTAPTGDMNEKLKVSGTSESSSGGGLRGFRLQPSSPAASTNNTQSDGHQKQTTANIIVNNNNSRSSGNNNITEQPQHQSNHSRLPPTPANGSPIFMGGGDDCKIRNPMAPRPPSSSMDYQSNQSFEGGDHRLLVDSPILTHSPHHQSAKRDGFNTSSSDQPLHFFGGGNNRSARSLKLSSKAPNKNMAPPHTRDANQFATPNVFNGRATTVYIRFIVHPPSVSRHPQASNEGSDAEGGGGYDDIVAEHPMSSSNRSSSVNILELEMRWLAKCVDVGMRLARAHGGALQYMQGCGLMVSFNAASRVMGHERRACVFALELRDEIRRFDVPDTLSMHTSIVATQVLSFFAGNRDQLMLTVLGGFMPLHTAMHHFMDTIGGGATAIIASPSVLAGVGDDVLRHRLIGVTSITLPSSPNTPPTLNPFIQQQQHEDDDGNTLFIRLHQLVKNISPTGYVSSDDDGDCSDKYVPNPLTTGTLDTLEMAVTFALNGSLDAAISALTNPFKSSDSNVEVDDDDISIHQSLLARLQRCRHSGASFIVPNEPTPMW